MTWTYYDKYQQQVHLCADDKGKIVGTVTGSYSDPAGGWYASCEKPFQELGRYVTLQWAQAAVVDHCLRQPTVVQLTPPVL